MRLLSLISISVVIGSVASRDAARHRKRADANYLEDIDDCKLPTLPDLPIEIPSNGRGKPLASPTPEMWEALHMNEWIQQIYTDCPAVKDALCDNDEYCGFTTTLSRLLIGGSKGKNGVNVYGGFKCDSESCSWSAASSKSNRGALPGDGNVLTLELNAKPSAIMTYRRWFALLALQNVWRYNQQLNTIISDSFLQSIIDIGKLADDLKRPDIKDRPIPPPVVFNFNTVFEIFAGVVSFVPFGKEITVGLSLIKGIVEIGTNKDKQVWGEAASTLAGNLIPAVAKIDGVIGKRASTVAKGLPAAQKFLKSNGNKPNDPAIYERPTVSMTDLTSYLSQMFTEGKSAFADQADIDIRTANGYYNMVSSGLFSSYEGKTYSQLEQARKGYTQWIRDKIAMKIYEANQVWLYRAPHIDRASCEKEIAALDFPGSTCVAAPLAGQPNRVFLYRPLVYRNWPANNDYGTARYYYDGLSASKLEKVNEDWTPEFVAQEAAKCFDATNSDWMNTRQVKDKQPCSSHKDIDSPAVTWPDEVRDAGTSLLGVPGRNTCHINIPVLETDNWYINQACTGNWMVDDKLVCTSKANQYYRPGQCFSPSSQGYWTFGLSYNYKTAEHRWCNAVNLNSQNSNHRQGSIITDNSIKPFFQYFPSQDATTPRLPNNTPGPAMYYAQQLFYPDSKQCNFIDNPGVQSDFFPAFDAYGKPRFNPSLKTGFEWCGELVTDAVAKYESPYGRPQSGTTGKYVIKYPNLAYT